MAELDTIFNNIKNSDSSTKFLYICIILFFIWIFKRVSIGLNIVFGILLGTLLILYINSNKQEVIADVKETEKVKSESIRPQPKKIQNYTDLLDFVFSIQDFYVYNPLAFEDIVDNLDYFLTIYEESKIIESTAGINYGLAERKKQEAVNALNSLIFNVPTNKIIIDKLERSTDKLNELLDNYLQELYDINKKYINDFGYDRNTRVITKGPKEANYYSTEPSNYNLF